MVAPRICLIPKMSGVGGMVSFQHKLAQGLADRGIEVCYRLADEPYQAVLVIGGIRDLLGLNRARRKGIKIIQRLDGMNWLHRIHKTGIRHFIRAEYGNLILGLIRSRLANGIIYQSQFSRDWWERVRGETRVPWVVIYNGVDLRMYSPEGGNQPPLGLFRILIVEGNLGGGYEMGLGTAIRLVEQLNDMKEGSKDIVELMVAGRVPENLKREWQYKTHVNIHYTGQVPFDQVPNLDRSAHVLFSADINAACPNSTIEALACGLPVLAFDTGGLPELVQGEAGRIVPYGGDPWTLDPPDVFSLAKAAQEIFENQDRFQEGARKRAVERFGLDKMVEEYLKVLLG